MSLNLPRVLILFSFFVVLLGTYQNCGIEQPKVEQLSMMSVGFAHSINLTQCSSCHNTQRPSGYVSNSQLQNSNMYIHNSVHSGTADCISCHVSSQSPPGSSWAYGSFNHIESNGAVTPNCNECHTGDMPKTAIVYGSTSFDHTSSVGSKDCSSCHINAGVSWATNTHTPVPTSCNTCHSAERPVDTQYFAADSSQPTKDLYAHTATFNGQNDCVSCHTSVAKNIGIKWSGGFYDHKANGSNISTCQDCHTGNRPSGLVGASNFDHASSGQGDCVSCHTNVGVDWSANAVPTTVTYLVPTVAAAGFPVTVAAHPSASSQVGMKCTTCHSNYNASFSIKAFDHINIPSGTKCYSCHAKTQQVLTGVSTQQVDISSTASNSDHRKVLSQSKDCSSCHTSGAGLSYPTWSTGTSSFSGGRWGSP